MRPVSSWMAKSVIVTSSGVLENAVVDEGLGRQRVRHRRRARGKAGGAEEAGTDAATAAPHSAVVRTLTRRRVEAAQAVILAPVRDEHGRQARRHRDDWDRRALADVLAEETLVERDADDAREARTPEQQGRLVAVEDEIIELRGQRVGADHTDAKRRAGLTAAVEPDAPSPGHGLSNVAL